LPGLISYRGFSGQLHQFLRDWSASRGSLSPTSELSAKTDGVIDELRGRRGMTPPYLEHTTEVPRHCPSRCLNTFDVSDCSVLRNRRALKCNRCGMLHFWTGLA